MQVTILCPQCPAGPLANCVASCDLRDDGSVVATCPAGHEIFGAFQNPKHEILFELGMRAFAERNYPNAVTNMASALERCLEFFTLVALSAHLDPNGNEVSAAEWGERTSRTKLLRKGWKSSSERQLGAFWAAHTFLTGRPPDWPDRDEKSNFRNKVVHQGYIPTPVEATDYARWVCEKMSSLVVLLFKRANAAWGFEMLAQMSRSTHRRDRQFNAFCWPTVINACNAMTPLTFEQALQRYRDVSIPWTRVAELRAIASVDEAASANQATDAAAPDEGLATSP